MGSQLTERFIQRAVAEGLNDAYYRRRSSYVSTEVYTRLRRADVLLAFMRSAGRPYVVVVEAKSRATIHQLRLRKDRNRTAWTARLLTLALIVGLSAAMGYQWYINAANILILLGVFVSGSLAITALVGWLGPRFTKSISAIQQLGRYPANESWIAVGQDTFAKPSDRQTLKAQCRKAGVGLIGVDRSGRLTILVVPRPRHTFNDYLHRYGRRNEILDRIKASPSYGPTPPERRQNRRRIFRVGVLLAFISMLILLVYEERAAPRTPSPAPNCPEVPMNEPQYVVVDAVLSSAAAEVRMARLAAAGLRGHELVQSECLQGLPGRAPVAITTGERITTLNRAREASRAYRALLEQLGVPVVDGGFYRISPPPGR